MTTPAAGATARTAVGISALLIVVHATNDAFAGMLAALLPTFQIRFGLTETALAALVATLSFSSSMTQPFFGALADTFGRRRLAAIGVATCSALLSLMAVAPSPWLLVALLLVGGLGSAAFHPAGTGIARAIGGRRRGLVMAVFSAGGTVGLALGPLLIGALVMRERLDLSPWLMLPGLAGAAALLWFVPPQPTTPRLGRAPLLDLSLLRGPVGALCAAGILRSISYATFVNATPLWLVTQRGIAPDSPIIFWSLTTFSLAAGAGGLVAGALERRWSRPVLISGSMLAALVPLGLVFVTVPGSFAYFACVAFAGAAVNAGLPLMVVAAQDLAPHAVGAASGFLMGFTWGAAGVIYIAVGALQEAIGVGPAMAVAYLMMLPGAALATVVLRRHHHTFAAAD
jgi:MFS transporter, FSR family, fosmidomycin resistance protein